MNHVLVAGGTLRHLAARPLGQRAMSLFVPVRRAVDR